MRAASSLQFERRSAGRRCPELKAAGCLGLRAYATADGLQYAANAAGGLAVCSVGCRRPPAAQRRAPADDGALAWIAKRVD